VHLSPGAVLADRYRMSSRIATGGMGEVWEALDTRLDRRVAVKVLKPEISSDAEFLNRFRVEARTAAALNHPGVAGVYDYGETTSLEDGAQETAYLVMELVEGEPLSAVLAREGRVDLALTLDMLEQTGWALQAAHERGFVHRDVKPGNLLITPAGQVKITDFGIAKAVDAAPVTRTGMVMGTAQYIAPEQALGQEASPASDVYSLGVVGYEAVAGSKPFVGDNPLTVAMMHIRDVPPPLPGDVPTEVRELLMATLTKDPAQRYRDGGEFADAVAAIRAGRRVPLPAGWMGGVAAGTAAATEFLAGPVTESTAALPTRPGTPVPLVARPADPAHRARSRVSPWLWLAGLLLVGLLALAGYALLSGAGSNRTPAPAPVTTTGPASAPSSTATTTPPSTTASTPPPETTTPPPPPTTTRAPVTTTTRPPVTTPPPAPPPTTAARPSVTTPSATPPPASVPTTTPVAPAGAVTP